MQFLEDDSQEWMRKAAEEFPVKPFGMNWEAVSKELHEEVPENGSVQFMLLRYAAMVVFFMLLSLVCNKYLQLDFENRYNAQVSLKQTFSNKDILKQSLHDKHAKERQIDGFKNKWSNGNTRLVASIAVELRHTKTNETTMGEIFQVNRQSPSFINSIPNIEHNSIRDNSFTKGLPTTSILEMSKAEEPVTQSEMQKTKVGVSTSGRLYMGLVFGPDISSVKFQKSDGVGYNVGLLLGYQLSSKWRLESGLLINRKEYYSSGKYFNAKETYLPPHSNITNVNGYCTMFEVPIQVRYNIQQKQQATWFATAGMSSYLMNKEDYDYTYKRYNQLYAGNKIYRNASKDWLTTFNASIGYEKELSKKIQLRLEPYVKLPLRGMGTGKLPITSAGMNIGVNYPIK